MKKNLRFLNLLLLFLTLLIGVVLSAGGLLFVTHKDALIKEVRVQIEQNASRAIGLPIQVGKIGGNLLNGIEAENISIGSSKKRGAPPFAHIPRLTVRYSLLDLLKLGKTPVRIDVYSPRARLMRDEKGKLGLSPEFPPAQKPGKKIPLPRFAFTLHGGRVSWQDRLGKPFGASLENLNGKGTLIDERAAFELSGKENKKNKEGTADLRLRGEVLLDQGRGNLDGTLSGASFKKWTDYLASSRDWQALEGSFDLGVGVKWSKSAFSLKGWTRLREGKLGLTAIKAPVEKVSGFARFDSKEVSIEGVTGLVAGNRILAKGKVLSIDKVPRLALSLEIPAVQLESMEKLLPEVGLFKLKGRGSVTARAFGLALDPRVEGKVAIPLGEAYGEDLRSVVGNFSFHRNKVSLTGINGAWDGGRVEASGFFTTETQPEVKIEGSWREVNLAVAMAPYFKGMKGASSGVLSVHGPANDLLVEGRATADGSILDLETKKGSFLFKVWPKRWMVSEASALVEGALLQGEASGLLTGAVSGKFSAELPFQRLKKFGLEAEGRGKIKGNFRGDSNEADSWEGAGFFDAASSSFEKQPIEEASSAWSFKKDRLFIRDAVIGLGGGRLSGSGELLLAKQPSATGKLRLEGVELAQVPLAQDLEALGRVSGKTSAEMSVSWLSGVLRAKGKVEGRNLAFSKVGKIERVAGPLYWGHQVLTTPGLDLRVGGQPLGVSGSFSLPASNPANPQFDLQLKAVNADLASLLGAFHWKRLIDSSPSAENDHIKDEIFLPKRGNDVLAEKAPSLGSQLEHWQSYHREPVAHSEEIHLAKTPFWNALQGKVFLNASLSGTAENPSFDLKAQVREARVYEKKIERAALSASYKNNRLSVPYLEISEGEEGGTLFASGNLGLPDDKLTLNAYRLKLDYLNPWLEESKLKVAGEGSFTVTMAGKIDDPKFILSSKVKSGQVNEFTFDQASAEASVHKGILKVERASISKEGKEATAFGTYPLLDPEKRIDLALRLEDDSLGILMLFSQDQLEWRGGSGFVEVNLAGTPNHPNLSGRAELAGIALKIKGLADPLTKIRGTLSLENNRLEVSPLYARFGSGDIEANGRIQLENYLPKALDLHLHSKPFKLKLENGLYDGIVETNVHLTGTVEEPVASGLILLSRGVINIKPPKAGQKEAAFPLDLSDLTLSLGSGIGLKLEPLIDLNLQGAMLVNGTLENPLPRGIIKIRGGTIMSLTNAFSVSDGKAEFNGAPDTSRIGPASNSLDAAVQITAKSRVYDYEDKKYYNVTANVTGTFLNMNLDFVSDPPLSPEKILDILGKKELIIQTFNRQLNGSEILTREGSDWLNNILTKNMVKPITSRMEDLFPIFDDLGFDLVSDSTKQQELELSGLNLSLYAETKPIFGNLTLSYRHQFQVQNQNRNYFRAGVNYRLNRSLGLQFSLEPNDSPDAGALSPEQKMGLNSALQLTTQYRF